MLLVPPKASSQPSPFVLRWRGRVALLVSLLSTPALILLCSASGLYPSTIKSIKSSAVDVTSSTQHLQGGFLRCEFLQSRGVLSCQKGMSKGNKSQFKMHISLRIYTVVKCFFMEVRSPWRLAYQQHQRMLQLGDTLKIHLRVQIGSEAGY